MARLLPAKWVWWYRDKRCAYGYSKRIYNDKKWNKTIAPLRPTFESLGLKEDDVARLHEQFLKIDKDGSGTIELWEMLDHLDLKRNRFAKRVFAIFDVDGSNEIDPDEFVAGIQSLDGGLTDAQCQRLMVQIDTDNSGTVDYSELTRALQKLDLRVEMHDFLVVCMRFFSLEMQRSAELLKAKFSAAVQKAMERPDSASSLGGSPQGARARPKSAGSAEGQLDGEGVTQLLKTMNAPFAPAVVQRLLANMHSAQQDEAKAKGRSQSEKRPSIAALDPETYYNCSAFVKVCMAYGFHAQSSPAFKEDTKRIATATNTMMAVNMFAKKMGKKTARAGSAERKALPMPTPGAAAAPAAAAPAEATAPAAAADLLLLSLKEAAATEAPAPAAAD